MTALTKDCMNFYPFHIGDYISHTSHLSDEEDLAYRRMIDLYYQTEVPFKDESFVARRVKTTPAIALVLLNEFFEQQEDGWHNKRADEEIAKYRAMQEGGRKGAALRWKKPSDSPPTLPLMQTKNQEPITINHIKNIRIPEGMNVVVWSDYLKLRNKQKKPLTETALKGLQREADKAKMPLVDALQICCERGWVGFKAEWIAESAQAVKPNNQAWRTNDALMMAKATELGLHTVGLQRYDIVNKIDATLRSRGL
jgi:uncharacterized protein YdaU (DUF1376 family)